MKRQVRELFISTTLVNLALAMVMLFEPIYLYKIGYGLQDIMLFYLIVYVVYFFIMPLGGKFARNKGFELGILIGTFLYISFYISLFFIAQYPWLFFVAPFIYALQKTFYWTSYHADFAKFADSSEEGKQISAMSAASSIVYIIGPALAGFIIVQWGYGVLFTVASVIFLASNIATLATKEKFIPASFSYRQVYKNLFSRENRQALLAYVGFGEELVALVVWPVFISIVIADIFNLGMIVALATFVTTMVTLFIGKLSDAKNKRKILAMGSYIDSLSWFIKIFIINTAGVFFVDTLSRMGKNIIAVPLIALTYEKAKEVEKHQKKSVMNRIVFFEMSLVLGKFLAILAIYIVTSLVADESLAFKITFILAGSMTLLYRLL
ncbi:MFS transporter [bacterium]|nr:MFS transporter [bacterium]